MTNHKKRTTRRRPVVASSQRVSETSSTKVELAVQARPVPGPDRGSTAMQLGVLRVSEFNCETLADVEPQALGLSYEFIAESEGDPYSVTVAFQGRRAGLKHHPDPGDRFDVSTTVEGVLPGSGRVVITTRVPELTAGSWHVVARPSAYRLAPDPSPSGTRAPLPRLAGGSADGSTGWAPVIAQQAPGVVLGSWAALVGLGAVVGLIVQAILGAHVGLPVPRVALVSLVASLIGLIGAKVYYLAVYPTDRRHALSGGGMCIQGFVLSAATALIIGAWITGVGIGLLLDVTAPALMFGMTIGRFGCFFGGCCVGRPTASRWGLWSSDRRLGTRRIPTQILESALAATIGTVALVVVVAPARPQLTGAIFVGTVAAYVLGRQLLLPLRAEPSKTRHGRVITLATAATALVADIVAAMVM